MRQFGVAQYLDAIGIDDDVLRRRQESDDDRPEGEGGQIVIGRVTRPQLPDRDDQKRLDEEQPAAPLTESLGKERQWQAIDERPEAVFLSLLPEAASFSRPVFGSTRSETPGPARLRVTYLKPFSFETP